MVVCYGLGLCVAGRADVEIGSRHSWDLGKFLWCKPAIKARRLHIQLNDEVCQQLG